MGSQEMKRVGRAWCLVPVVDYSAASSVNVAFSKMFSLNGTQFPFL